MNAVICLFTIQDIQEKEKEKEKEKSKKIDKIKRKSK